SAARRGARGEVGLVATPPSIPSTWWGGKDRNELAEHLFVAISILWQNLPILFGQTEFEMKTLACIACLVLFASLGASAQTRESAQITLIKNGTVLTVSHGTLANTDVLLRSGKIAAVV